MMSTPDSQHAWEVARRDDVLRIAAQIQVRWARTFELLAQAEQEEQREAVEEAERHMDSPWPPATQPDIPS